MISFGLPRNDVVQIVCGSYDELPAVERNGTIGRVRTDEGEDVYIYWDGWHLMGGKPQEGDVPADMMLFDVSSGEHAVLVGISDEYVVPEDGYNLVVPATYQGLPVTTIGSGDEPDWDDPFVPVFFGCKAVSSDAALSIADYAFVGCASLTGASFPAATSIGQSAFSECASLDAVSFPAATSIGENAFNYCASLASASFPEVRDIADYAFYRCTSLTAVSFPEVTSIGEDAFWGCTALDSISFPKAESIGMSAFSSCTSLTEASFPAATALSQQSFGGCTALSSASFPAVSFIDHYAFSLCTGITEVEFGPITTITTSSFDDWTFYDTDGTTVLNKTVENLRNSTFRGTASKLVKQIPS